MSSENINDYLDKKIGNMINKYNVKGSDHKIKSLVLSGGGIKGIALIGALKCLEEHNVLCNITKFVGASIGGIIACLHCIGYTPDELIKFVELFDLKNLKSFKPSDFFTKFGLDDGSRLTFVLEKMIESKNLSKHITFGELYQITKKHLIITTVCLNDEQAYYLSHITHPKMPIITGMRMTSALPLWFIPISHNGKLYVDGGCIDNYPIQLFEKELHTTLGIYLANTKHDMKKILNTEDFLFSLLSCCLEGVTCKSIKGFEKHTVKITVPRVNFMDLDIDSSFKMKLYNCGYEAIKKYLKHINDCENSI